MLGLANSYRKQGDAPIAIGYYKQAETISKEVSSSNYELKEAYSGQAMAYSELSDFKNAFKYETLFTGIKDSLYNLDIC